MRARTLHGSHQLCVGGHILLTRLKHLGHGSTDMGVPWLLSSDSLQGPLRIIDLAICKVQQR